MGYSVLFGAAAGVGLAGGMYLGRTFKVALFDTDYLRQQSRLRYNEKQTVFMQEQIAENKAHYLSELAKEYDPVALRMPKGKMDMKYAFWKGSAICLSDLRLALRVMISQRPTAAEGI